MKNKLNQYLGIRISRVLINQNGHIAINYGSSDCDSVIVCTETDNILFKHKTPGKYGIAAEFTNDIDVDFNIEIDLSGGNYFFEKIIFGEKDEFPETVVFKSEKDYLHIMSSDYDLIVTKSLIDLSTEIFRVPEEDNSILLK